MSEDKKKALPENAKLVFEGEIFKVYQWEQELYDGSKAIFEKVERPDSVDVIAVVEDRVILLHQKQPYGVPFISLPGGRVEEGENSLDAAGRELLEETGYQSENLSLWRTLEDTGVVLWKREIYIARDCKKIHDGTPDAGEKIEVSFIGLDDLLLLSENADFRSKSGLKDALYYLRLHPEEQEEFKKLLFS